MKISKFGEMVLEESDLVDLVMQGREPWSMQNLTVDPAVDLERIVNSMEDPGALLLWTFPEGEQISVAEFDRGRQATWFMPDHYKDFDIAQHVISLCSSQEELQRVGQELLLFQERDLFDLLRYLRYLVDVMKDNHVIWGVGRGSSVASYVLYLMGVHRINSMYYDLDIREFLR